MELLIGVGLVILLGLIGLMIVRGLFKIARTILLVAVVVAVAVHFLVMPLPDMWERYKVWSSVGDDAEISYDKDTGTFNVKSESNAVNLSYNNAHDKKFKADLDVSNEEAVEGVIGLAQKYLDSVEFTGDVSILESENVLDEIEKAGGNVTLGSMELTLSNGRLLIETLSE